ncbi:hypothetical protein LF296_12680 [Acinetobacter vivianii]|uniref:Uncharacterized protein n=1 Tax=Acinetobacter vivianii TaxID=1776742 RepID=A0AAJ6NGY6_9GAMM|nr:hypothetical protein [Acinetobacter vivianii]WDZ50175.1 hypothetical protein LF296_12680 [Acinetobacter vivianii]
MSILLLVLFLLAIIHLFYQGVILKTNNELFEADMDLLKHEFDIYTLKQNEIFNGSEKEYIAHTQEFINDCKVMGRRLTAVEMILSFADFQSSKEFDSGVSKSRSLKAMNSKIWDFNVSSGRLMARNVTSNGSLMLFVLSPFLFLVLLYTIISGRKLRTIDQNLERLSTRHC